MRLFICNALSLNMLADPAANLRCRRLGNGSNGRRWLGDALRWAERERASVVPAIGHADMARVAGAALVAVADALGVGGVPTVEECVAVAATRPTVLLGDGDCALVAQYRGPRLPEGATALPEGATIEWWAVDVTTPAVE
ncbi:MAG: hypothetical protein ABII76_07220 [Pseudomonadota bacterium]